ncbi:MAG: hypothetical protein ACP5O0_00505 [Acidimicrobiales bacterium]
MSEAQSIQVPRPDDVEDVLGALLGRTVTAKRLPPGDKVHGAGVVGGYFDESGALRALIWTERQLVTAAGGALSMIPSGAVEDANDEGEIPETMFDNYREILNIFASMFNDKRQRAEHVRLKEVTSTSESADQVAAFEESASKRLDISVVVAGGYGGGGLAVIVR